MNTVPLKRPLQWKYIESTPYQHLIQSRSVYNVPLSNNSLWFSDLVSMRLWLLKPSHSFRVKIISAWWFPAIASHVGVIGPHMAWWGHVWGESIGHAPRASRGKVPWRAPRPPWAGESSWWATGSGPWLWE